MKHPLLTLLLALFLLPSCGGGNRADFSGSEMESVSDSQQDSSRLAGQDSITTEVKKELSFSTPQEAREYMRNSPDADRYMSGILPQMAYDDLSYCTRLLNSEFNGFIVVDKERMKVIFFDRYGVAQHTYGMACARHYGSKHKKADSRTPEGLFSVEGIYDSTDWLFTDDNGVQSKKKGQFGPRFIRLKTPVSSQIGIHGTCAPWSIGGRSSHGCIRITNENILELVKLVTPGMPVIVSPGHKDIAVNEKEGYDIASISTIPGRNRATSKSEKLADKSEEKQTPDSVGHDSVSHDSSSVAPIHHEPTEEPEEYPCPVLDNNE